MGLTRGGGAFGGWDQEDCYCAAVGGSEGGLMCWRKDHESPARQWGGGGNLFERRDDRVMGFDGVDLSPRAELGGIRQCCQDITIHRALYGHRDVLHAPEMFQEDADAFPAVGDAKSVWTKPCAN